MLLGYFSWVLFIFLRYSLINKHRFLKLAASGVKFHRA